MTTTIKGLKNAFKKANKRVDKAIDRYKNFIFALYMPANENCRKSKLSGDYADVYLTCLNSDGTIREYASDLSWTFYRRGRGGKFYEKERYAGREWDANTQTYQPVGQDYLELCKLENTIDLAVDEREQVLNDLEKIGVNVFEDAEF